MLSYNSNSVTIYFKYLININKSLKINLIIKTTTFPLKIATNSPLSRFPQIMIQG